MSDPKVEPSEHLAHPALRALAFALDGVGTFVLVCVAAFISLFQGLAGLYESILLLPLAIAIVATVLTATRGVTPGKALVGLRVVDAATGGRIGWRRALLRSAVIAAPGVVGWIPQFVYPAIWEYVDYDAMLAVGFAIPLALWTALLVVLAVSPRYRGLQDRAGRSVVVRR